MPDGDYIARRDTKRNPNSIKWSLILWLIGNEPLEAVPLDLQDGISTTKTVRIRLGQPGSFNTVERLDGVWRDPR